MAVAFGGLLVVWNPVPLVGVLGRPQFLSSPGSAVALVGCTAFARGCTAFARARDCAVRRASHTGYFFGFWRRGGLCGPFVSAGCFFFSLLGRAVALWGHAALFPGQFLISGGAAAFAGRSCPPVVFPVNPEPRGGPLGSCRVGLGTIFGLLQAARSPWLVALRTPNGAISCLWEVLGHPGGALASPPAGNFCWGGGEAGPRSYQGEALSLHFDWVDPCDYPKCG